MRPFDIERKFHIGKSSNGWCFTLHVIPERGVTSLHHWLEWFVKPYHVIMDEYGEIINPNEMQDIIERRGDHKPSQLLLRRHELGKYHCIGHGEGNYDYCIGTFN